MDVPSGEAPSVFACLSPKFKCVWARPGIGGASNNDENAVSCRRRNNVAVRLIFLRLYEKIRAEVIVV